MYEKKTDTAESTISKSIAYFLKLRHYFAEKFVDATASASGSPSPPLAEFERDSPVDVSSTSEAGSASGACGSRALSPPPRNPQLAERWSSEEMKHIQCHLETKELWDKFNELGTEMIITKTGR